MTPEVFLKAQIAAFAQQEAVQMGGFEPMLAVACVLRNRVKAGWHGGEWMANINYAAGTAALEPVAPLPLDIGSQAFRRVLGDVEDIFTGTYVDTFTGGGLYYLDSLYVEHGRHLRQWFLDDILRGGVKHGRIAQVGLLWIFS